MARSTHFDRGRIADACPGSESSYAQRFQCGNVVRRLIWTRMNNDIGSAGSDCWLALRRSDDNGVAADGNGVAEEVVVLAIRSGELRVLRPVCPAARRFDKNVSLPVDSYIGIRRCTSHYRIAADSHRGAKLVEVASIRRCQLGGFSHIVPSAGRLHEYIDRAPVGTDTRTVIRIPGYNSSFIPANGNRI